MPTFGFAVAGLLIGHFLAYLLAVPDPDHRDLVLRDTGHVYLPTLGQVALILFAAAVVTVTGRAIGASRRADRARLTTLAGRLVVLQVGAFAIQEVAERLVARAPLGDLLSTRVLIVGVVAEAIVAVVAASLLHWWSRIASRIAQTLRSRAASPRPVPALALTVALGRPARLPILGSLSARAPPAG